MYKNIFSIETLKNSVGRRLLVKIAFTHKNLLPNLLSTYTTYTYIYVITIYN